MGLGSVLSTANQGLNLTQRSLDVVAQNIANADTVGYTKKSLQPVRILNNGTQVGITSVELQRSVDTFLQGQIWTETAAFNGADVRHQFLERLDQLFGAPGAANSLDTLIDGFSGSLQELTGAPDSFATRAQVVGDAEALAQQLRQLSGDIQSLRQLTENTIAADVGELNSALQSLSDINRQFALGAVSNTPSADLLDERDKFIGQISQYIEINVTEKPDGAVSIVSRSGNTLLGNSPVTLSFDQRGDVTATSLYSGNDADRGVGTISLESSGGFTIDLIQNNGLTTGRIGALVDLRDNILVEAQAQLDELAHGLALALSNSEVEGVAATVGAAQGFDVDVAALQPGNPVSVTYTTTPPGTSQTVTIVRVDDASQLPLSNDVTTDPNDTVIGIDFSAGVAAAATAIDTALGTGVSVSNPAGTTLRFLDDGAIGTTDITAVSATVTATAVQDAGLGMPLFIDGGLSPQPYTGSLEGGPQKLGFASRISINSLVQQDNELLVRHSTSPVTPLGDPDRPVELFARLSEQPFSFSPSSGIGSTQNPVQMTITAFADRVIAEQTGKVESAAREKAAKDVALQALQIRFDSEVGVDTDSELTDLINLQTSYAANARIIQAVDELMQILLNI